MNTIAVSRLRETLAERFPDAQPLVYRTADALATSIEELDRLLPGGGLPRGQLTVWRPGGGATAVLRAACMATVRRGERAAWVDAGGQIPETGWATGPLLLRPEAAQALECAEELSRCGGFGLVILGPGPFEIPVRLGRAVREGGGALVAVNADSSQARLRVESRLKPESWSWRRGPFGEPSDVESAVLKISAWTLGWSGQAEEFRLPVLTHGSRLALDPLLVDRRGAPRRAIWPASRPRPAAGTSSTASTDGM